MVCVLLALIFEKSCKVRKLVGDATPVLGLLVSYRRSGQSELRGKAARVHIAVVAFAVEWRTVVLDPARRIP